MNNKPTGIEAIVCADITRRQGLTSDNPIFVRLWLKQEYEETLDRAIYLRRVIDEIDRTSGAMEPAPSVKWELMVSHRGELRCRTFVSLVTLLNAAHDAWSDFDAGSYPDSIFRDGVVLWKGPHLLRRRQFESLELFAVSHGIIREKLDGPFIQT